MAARFFLNIGTNWSSTANWSTTSGGAGGASVPTSSDDVTFDANSGDCTLDVTSRVCKTFTATNYTHTITFTNGLTVSGNVTLGSGMTFAGGGSFTIDKNATLTSNGKHFGVQLVFFNNNTAGADLTITLADNAYSDLSFSIKNNYTTSSQNIFINGFSLSLMDNFADLGGIGSASSRLFGTTVLTFVGSSTVSGFNSGLSIDNPISINCTSLYFDNSILYLVLNGNFTYIAGAVTFDPALGTLAFGPGITLDTGSLVFDITYPNTIQLTSGTYTLNSPLKASYISFATSQFLPDITLAGGNGFEVDYLLINEGTHLHLSAGASHTITTDLTFVGFYGDNVVTGTTGNQIDSTSPGTQAILTVSSTATVDIVFATVTDIDSSGGQTLWSYDCVLTNATNWKAIPLTLQTVSKTFSN